MGHPNTPNRPQRQSAHPCTRYRGQTYILVKCFDVAGGTIELWAAMCADHGCSEPFVVRRNPSRFDFWPNRRCSEHAKAGIKVEPVGRAAGDEAVAAMFISAAATIDAASPVGIDEWSLLFVTEAKARLQAAKLARLEARTGRAEELQ